MSLSRSLLSISIQLAHVETITGDKAHDSVWVREVEELIDAIVARSLAVRGRRWVIGAGHSAVDQEDKIRWVDVID